MDMEQDHSDFVEPPAGSSLAKIAASGMTPAEYSRRQHVAEVTITPFAIQKAIDALDRQRVWSRELTYCSCGVDNFDTRRECRSCRAPLVHVEKAATPAEHVSGLLQVIRDRSAQKRRDEFRQDFPELHEALWESDANIDKFLDAWHGKPHETTPEVAAAAARLAALGERRYDGCYNCNFDNDEQREDCPVCGQALGGHMESRRSHGSKHPLFALPSLDRPHQRIEAAERDHLAKMDAKVGEAVQKIQPDHRWSLLKDGMAGQAIHGPHGTYVPIRNPLIGAVLEAALKGDLIRLQQARDDLAESLSAKAP